MAVPLLLDLDDPACLDPLAAGAKAARLAAARAGGLPALPGVVVPVAAARDALAGGLAALTTQGRHAAQLRVMSAGVTPALAAELRHRGAQLGDRLVVRSSSPLEASGAWSGAFTSYLGVRPDELATAVAGCWAAALGRDALERATRLGRDPADLALAVLIQPEVEPLVSGTAAVTEKGDGVRVIGVEGAPAPLLTGWSAGLAVEVRAGAVTNGRDAARQLGAATVLAVARLAEAVAATFGDDTIEWAAVEGRPLLLQSAACERRPPSTSQPQFGSRVEAARAHLTTAAGSPRVADRAELHTHAAAMEHGERFQGQPAAPGIAAGPARVAGQPQQPPPLQEQRPERAVLVARYPLPPLAPLLWGAAAMVTSGGSPAAHLFHVARSLGVPAVAACGALEGQLAPAQEVLLAVDGGAGVVALTRPAK